MLKAKKIVFCALLLLFTLSNFDARAQAGTGQSGSEGSESSFDARNAFGTILVAGLVGGVLGLSTLSFYAKPNEHLRNITLGAGAGMIGTALYLTFAMATDPKNVADAESSPDPYALAFVPLVDLNFQGISFNAKF